MVRLFIKTKELIYVKFLEPFPGFMYSIQLPSTPPFLFLFLSSLAFYRWCSILQTSWRGHTYPKVSRKISPKLEVTDFMYSSFRIHTNTAALVFTSVSTICWFPICSHGHRNLGALLQYWEVGSCLSYAIAWNSHYNLAFISELCEFLLPKHRGYVYSTPSLLVSSPCGMKYVFTVMDHNFLHR